MKKTLIYIFSKPYYRLAINILLLLLGMAPVIFSGSGLNLVLPGGAHMGLEEIYKHMGIFGWTDFGSIVFYILFTISMLLCLKNKEILKLNKWDSILFGISFLPLAYGYLGILAYLYLILAFSSL